jgi:hypothetical protein
MFRLSLAVLLAGTAVATAQPKAKPDPKAQLEAAVSKTLGGRPGTAYAVLLVTETPDGKLKQSGALIFDIFTLPARVGFWATGQTSPFPWMSDRVDARSSWAVEVAVFADTKAAADAIAAFGLGQEAGQPRSWRLVKRAEGAAAAVRVANAEQTKLDKQAKANAKLTVTRRPDPVMK